MKKRLLILALIIMGMTLSPRPAPAQIPIISLITGAVKKVVKAFDLKIQRMQTKVIGLQNAQKVLENEMAKLKLKDIADWTKKQQQLYQKYYDELKKVKSAISTYKAVKDIIVRQEQLITEYKNAWKLLRQDTHFSAGELEQMYQVYNGILEESIQNIDQLMLVIHSFSTQMSDGARMELIHTAGKGIDRNLSDLRGYNDRNFRISLLRARNQQEAAMIKKLYGIQ